MCCVVLLTWKSGGEPAETGGRWVAAGWGREGGSWGTGVISFQGDNKDLNW